jgi:hypothetical protein
MPCRSRLTYACVYGLGALPFGLADLGYHDRVFGGWMNTESDELTRFALDAAAETGAAVWDVFARGYEFGWILPLVGVGSWVLARRHPLIFIALALWIVPSVLFHLPYTALRLRDLLCEFPALAVLIGYGTVWLLDLGPRATSAWPRWPAALLLLILTDLFVLRSWEMAARPFLPAQYVFGYQSGGQRASFERIKQLTPPASVVAAAFNDGPVDLYAQRTTVHPGAWPPEHWRQFACAMQRDGRPLFILEDGSAAEELVNRARISGWELRPIARFDVQFADGEETAEEWGTFWSVRPGCEGG